MIRVHVSIYPQHDINDSEELHWNWQVLSILCLGEELLLEFRI